MTTWQPRPDCFGVIATRCWWADCESSSSTVVVLIACGMAVCDFIGEQVALLLLWSFALDAAIYIRVACLGAKSPCLLGRLRSIQNPPAELGHSGLKVGLTAECHPADTCGWVGG
jgi:hypothetical protein